MSGSCEVKIFPLWDVCAGTQTRVPPVAAEGATSKQDHGRQRRRQRGRTIFRKVEDN